MRTLPVRKELHLWVFFMPKAHREGNRQQPPSDAHGVSFWVSAGAQHALGSGGWSVVCLPYGGGGVLSSHLQDDFWGHLCPIK